MRVRLVTGLFVAPLLLATAFVLSATPARAFTTGPSCGEQKVKSDKGIAVRILFARNGAVQRYIVLGSQGNVEGVNDFRIRLEARYGPEGLNAPPLRIVSFKPGGNGMQIPDKAIDSCGRTLSFQ